MYVATFALLSCYERVFITKKKCIFHDFGIMDLRTTEPFRSDSRTFFSNLRTFGLKNLRTHEPSNLRTFGLIGCNRQKQADTMEKEVAHLQGWFKGMRDNFARLDKLPKCGSGQRVFTEMELWTMQKMHFLQKITYHKPEPVSSVSRTTAISSSLGTIHCLVRCNELPPVVPVCCIPCCLHIAKP